MAASRPSSFPDPAADRYLLAQAPAESCAGAAAGRLGRWIGPLLCAAAFVGLTSWSWRKWPDILVDFGHELYVPWQLTEGKVLYRDIAFLHGPFSQYLNAVWFQLFGVSLTTLIFCNLAILAGMSCLVYRMLAEACDRLTATVGCLFLLLIFGFSQYLTTGNYNFVCPYSHEATHGVALSVAMIRCLTGWSRFPAPWRHPLAGLCLGACLLTRLEIAVGALVAAITWLCLHLSTRRASLRCRLQDIAVCLAATFIPMLGFFVFFRFRMPADQAFHALTGWWTSLPLDAFSRTPFFRQGLGLDDVPGNLSAAMKMFALMVLPMLGAAGVDLALRKRATVHAAAGVGLALGVLPCLLWQGKSATWWEIGRPLPLVIALIGLSLIAALLRQRGNQELVRRLMPLAVWSAFALALLGKMILKARLDHYGFYLAMPAALMTVACVLWMVPQLLARRQARSWVVSGLSLASLLATAIMYLGQSNTAYRWKDFPVGRGGDVIYTPDPRFADDGVVICGLVERVIDRTPADATLAVLPEGVMVNYLARRVNPTPYTTFMMTEMLAFGEDAMLAGFQRHPPDFIALIPRNTEEFGVGLFGTDPRYGLRIMQWINAEYESFLALGPQPPSDSGQYGVKIMRRRVAALAPPSATSPTMK